MRQTAQVCRQSGKGRGWDADLCVDTLRSHIDATKDLEDFQCCIQLIPESLWIFNRKVSVKGKSRPGLSLLVETLFQLLLGDSIV
jgi:hypothetical protein